MADKKALLFPGQGSQHPGMGKELWERYESARAVYRRADSVLGTNLTELSFEGPREELTRTINAQPAIYVHSMACWSVLRESGIEADYVAGHSLGEYTAVAAAGGFSFEEGLKLVRRRGELMQQAGDKNPGTMAAIMDLEPEVLERVCSETRGVVQIANYNSPNQFVISGEPDAVRRALERAKSEGARRAVMLDVSGAFHSPLMADAANGLAEALERTQMEDLSVPVVSNYTARPEREARVVKENLSKQLLGSVRWSASMQWLIEDGVKLFMEIGPGSVLRSLLRRIDRSAEAMSVSSPGDIEELSSKLGLRIG